MGISCATVLSGFLITLVLSVTLCNCKIKDIYSWEEMEFHFQNEDMKQAELNLGAKLPGLFFAMGVDVWKNKLFLALPRVARSYVPATLTYINLNDLSNDTSPELKPYPNWETHQVEKAAGPKIISVAKINVDACDRLWMIDAGEAFFSGSYKTLRPPRVLVYDLNTDELINEHPIPKGCLNIIPDVTVNNCNKAFAYALCREGILVYDFGNKKSWTYGRESGFDLYGGALSHPDAQGHRTLYFLPLSYGQAFPVMSLSTKVLQDKTAINNDTHPKPLHALEGSWATFDEKSGVFFYANKHKNTVSCWNSKKHGSDTHSVISVKTSAEISDATITDVKVDKNGNFWLIKLFEPAKHGPSNSSVIVSKAKIAELIDGTVCADESHDG